MPSFLVPCLLMFLAALSAAETDTAHARKLLESAVEMSGAVHPETGVAALMRAGMAVGTFDKKVGLALLSRAFTGLPSVSREEVRAEYAAAIVRAAADLDVQTATEFLRQVSQPAAATTAVVRQLITDKRFDEAMELIALLPEQVEYPYEAASYVIASLPADDPRRTITFGRASAAFGRLPVGPFPMMLERFGKGMPAEARDRAVGLLLQRISAWKDGAESFGFTGADNESEVELHSREQTELRELVSVARMFDPAAVDAILARRADVVAALAGFRKPRNATEPLKTDKEDKPEDEEMFSPPFSIGMVDGIDGFQKTISEYGDATKRAEAVGALIEKDPAEAVRQARQLPEVIRSEALALIALRTVQKDPALAQTVVDACVAEVERSGRPGSRIAALVKLGGVYVKLGDRAKAFAAYERAVQDVAPLWNHDTNASRPNVASRDTWPSTQALRTTVYEAAVQLRMEAEGLLPSLNVGDLAVLARIQIARALLGLPMDVHQINVQWVDGKK